MGDHGRGPGGPVEEGGVTAIHPITRAMRAIADQFDELALDESSTEGISLFAAVQSRAYRKAAEALEAEEVERGKALDRKPDGVTYLPKGRAPGK